LDDHRPLFPGQSRDQPFQFALKMTMVIALAVFAVRAVGGVSALKLKIAALDAAAGGHGSRLSLFPDADSAWMPLITLFVYLGVSWWATWYPGAEPGGGGYVAQRIFSARDERHGVLATLWFNVAHYALRPWPWILTALASLLLYPDLADKEAGYIRVLMDPAVFPQYLRGFMLAAFAAAYMSTVGPQLNWGASYVINDCYRRFLRPRRRTPLRDRVAAGHDDPDARVRIHYPSPRDHRERRGSCSWSRAPAPERCCFSADSGGASTRGRKSRPWRSPRRFRSFCSL
jgi:hypothetical protein